MTTPNRGRQRLLVTTALWAWGGIMAFLYLAQFADKARALAGRLLGH